MTPTLIKPFLFFTLISSFHFLTTTCFEFDVGGPNGWTLPDSNTNDQIYNKWASKNRFIVNDTIHFKYKKDSVMEVSEDEYNKCRSSRPIFYSNNGDSVFTFEKPGLYYFISGVDGHCEKGLKMIIKVLEPQSPQPSPTPNGTTESPPASHAAKMAANMLIMLFMSCLWFIFNQL